MQYIANGIVLRREEGTGHDKSTGKWERADTKRNNGQAYLLMDYAQSRDIELYDTILFSAFLTFFSFAFSFFGTMINESRKGRQAAADSDRSERQGTKVCRGSGGPVDCRTQERNGME